MEISLLEVVLGVILGNILSFGVAGFILYHLRGLIREKFMSSTVDHGVDQAQDMVEDMVDGMLGGGAQKQVENMIDEGEK